MQYATASNWGRGGRTALLPYLHMDALRGKGGGEG